MSEQVDVVGGEQVGGSATDSVADSVTDSVTDEGQVSTPKRPGRRLARFLPRTRRSRLLSAIALLLVAGLGLWFFVGRPQTTASTTATKQTVTLATTTLKSTVSASGSLQPKQQADLSFSSGKVTSVLVAVGDAVTAGQSLATIDPSSLQIAYQSATADLTAAKETLADLKSSSSSSSAAIRAATASVQVKTNAVTQAKNNLAAATMTAPFDGLVAQVNIATGDSVGSGGSGSSGNSGGAGGSSGTGTTSSSAGIVVISKGTFTVSTTVSNSDVASIKRGLQAVITPTGSSTPVYGTVSSVGVVASSSSSGTSSGSATFPVTIDVTGTQNNLLAGSSVAVQIVTAQFTDVIAVATQALTTANGKTTVLKVVDGAEVATPVTLGQVVGNQTIVTEGLAEGDQIIVTGVRVASGGGTSTARAGNGSGSGQGQQMPMGEGGFPGGAPPAGGQMPQGGGNR